MLRFGDVLKQQREAAGLTQDELARLAGLSPRGISDLERGIRRTPHPQTMRLLADALQLDDHARATFAASARRSLTPTSPPAPASSSADAFVGRERELTEVLALLQTESLVTLSGPGGVGKTRLALEVARRLGDSADLEVAVVDLSQLSEARLVPQAVVAALDIHEQPNRSTVDVLLDALPWRLMLLVLDNCEHLADACAELLDRLLPACRELRVLATTQTPLGCLGERVYRVPTLSLPTDDDLAGSDSAALFVMRAAAALPGFRVTRDNAAAIAAICRQVDGLALAIELAAARVPLMGLEQIAARLGDQLRVLGIGRRAPRSRHGTLRAAFEWSTGLLSESDRRVFEQLGVFAGGFALDDAEAVCHEADVLQALAQLVDRSLVVVDADHEGVEVRYRLLESVRQFARERLVAQHSLDQMRRRHAEHFLEVASQIHARLTSSGQVRWMRQLDRDYPNLQLALDWFIDHGEVEHAVRMAAGLARFLDLRGYIGEARHSVDRILVLLGACGDRRPAAADLVRFYAWAARVAWRQGDYAAAQARCEDGHRAPESEAGPVALGLLLNAEGGIAWQTGDLRRAHELNERVLSLLRISGDEWELGNTLSNMATVVEQMGDMRTARELYLEALRSARERSDLRGLSYVLCNLALLYVRTGEVEGVQAMLEEALNLAEEMRDPYCQGNALSDLGHLAHEQGRLADAHAWHAQALRLRRGLGDRHGVASSLANLAAACLDMGEVAEAASLFRDALARYHALGAKSGALSCVEGLAAVAMHGGFGDRASTLRSGAEALRESLGVRRMPMQTRRLERWLGPPTAASAAAITLDALVANALSTSQY